MYLLNVSGARYVRQALEAAIVKPEPRGADQRPKNSVCLIIANSKTAEGPRGEEKDEMAAAADYLGVRQAVLTFTREPMELRGS